jgi:Domain of unknown function (DUF4432)
MIYSKNMEIYGIRGRRNLEALTSHPQQVVGAELLTILDGEGVGQRIIRVRNGELDAEILVDRGFDISRIIYRGVPVHWTSPAGNRNANSFTPSAINPDGWGWLRSWPGGFLSTIGIDHVGGPRNTPNRHLHPAVTEERRFTGGFISLNSSSIEKIETDWEKGVITVQALVRQAAAFAEQLEMRRTLTFHFGEPSFNLRDEVYNRGYVSEAVQVLYHVNLGWPLVAPGTTLKKSAENLIECIDSAKSDDPLVMPNPKENEVERVWDWDASGGMQFAELTSPSIGSRGKMKFKIEWDGKQLPHFMHWRNACETLYVQGLEPATAGLQPRESDKSKAGPSPMLHKGESRVFNLNFSFDGL